ncbi:MAG: hypothetical protein WCP99_13700 [Burkholderiales bacterium]
MTWFERLTGFAEGNYDVVRSKLEVDGQTLRSRVNGQGFRIGTLELASLGELRTRALTEPTAAGKPRFSIVQGDARKLHAQKEYNRALFQVASQFNLLEMTSPNVTPEDGVGRYQTDPTQGPACAIAAGAATIYRNYFALVDGQPGQRADRQLDGLGDLGQALSVALGVPVTSLWSMRNGYALCTQQGLELINEHLASLAPIALDALRSKLRIGLHWDVEVTDGEVENRPLVSQAFCSALPVAYSHLSHVNWQPFASLILEASYEATLLGAILNARRGASKTVLLTLVGGGVFGNERDWILGAIRRALRVIRGHDVDVRVVSYGHIPEDLRALAANAGEILT